jgi:sterol desaturase/sphingolipid hydroxylase (fatty acid hydroxylase superfamily)
MDVSVAVSPLYFASMAAERKQLQRRAEALGPTQADYEPNDTRASLGMGVLSLTSPITLGLATRAALRRGSKGRVGKVVLGVAVTAAVITTIADRVVVAADVVTETGRRTRTRARAVAEVGGVVAVAAGGLVLTATSATLTSTTRAWRKGRRLDLGNGVVPWTAAMLWWDFAYYWNHRFQHEIRAMWAIHVVHHSSERYNLSTALRQPVADALGTFVPYGLLGLLGVRPEVIETARGINLIYQFWIHTEAIGTLGPLEGILNTASAHRVHHGSNRQYLDRNHGSILIIWDRLFGTYEPEGERVVYGLTKNIDTFDPVRIATHEYVDMAHDVASSDSWRDRLSYVFRGPGWADERRRDPQTSSDDTGMRPVAAAS